MRPMRSISTAVFAVLLCGACGGTSSGVYGAEAATEAMQKASAAVIETRHSGSYSGASTSGSSACTADQNGVAWCESSSMVVVCSDGAWRAVECSSVGTGPLCALMDDRTIGCRQRPE